MATVLFINTGIFQTSIWYFTCQLCTSNQCLMDYFPLNFIPPSQAKLSRNDRTRAASMLEGRRPVYSCDIQLRKNA